MQSMCGQVRIDLWLSRLSALIAACVFSQLLAVCFKRARSWHACHLGINLRLPCGRTHADIGTLGHVSQDWIKDFWNKMLVASGLLHDFAETNYMPVTGDLID